MDKSQQFCLGKYIFSYLNTIEYNQLLSDYNIITFILKNFCLEVCLEKLCIGNTFYAIHYLTKYSPFKDKIKKHFNKYAYEIYKNIEQIFKIENNDYLLNNYSEKYQIQNYINLGKIYHYGIYDLLDANKEKALTYFTKGYKLAKEKHYLYLIKISYLFMYKARKHLFKKNMITLRKLNKTQKKLLKIYEEAEENYLSAIELYNYYRLYKFGVIGNSREKVLRLLKSGKKENNTSI